MKCSGGFYVKNSCDVEVRVPCGKCPACLLRRASGWSFRLKQEYKVSNTAYFITLTYATSNLPFSEFGFPTLCRRDLQLFFKRLRKRHSCEGIKYYAVGEYGSNTKRPHYHVILFNASMELIQPAWQLGSVHYGEVNSATIGYTLKYMCKPHLLKRYDDRVKQFSLMSKGLGKSYLTDDMVNWHLASVVDRVYCNLLSGQKVGMPRYYKDKIYSEQEKEAIRCYNEVLESQDRAFLDDLRLCNEFGVEKYVYLKQEALLRSYEVFYKNQNLNRVVL